ncbi:MAG: hypothetical protein ACAI44_07275 [Candidatus Sericytochromatia bacterium]
MIQSAGNPEFSHFQQRLSQFKTSEGNISLTEAQQARKLAKTLQPPEQNQALDLLQQEVTHFGSQDAKAFYSFNPSLDLVDVLSALPPEAQSEGLRALIQDKQSPLELETLLTLPVSRQQELVTQARQALTYYQARAAEMRSAINPVSEKAQELEAFLEIFESRQKDPSTVSR